MIVNATPVGMYPHNGTAPVDVVQFPELEGAIDLIYNPARTQLLLDCEKYGIPGWNGLWMLVAQAKKSAEWFLDEPLPDSTVSVIHRKLRDRMENIALVGMAGCGKSSIGRLLAKETGKRFVDADSEVEQLAGKSIPEIFAEDGEDVFRRLETEVLAQLGKQSGLVIATGGGCVTREENYPLLHQNSRILWLKRCPARLPTEGRPLSRKTSPAKLYEQRKPMYKAFGDAAVDNDGTRGETLTQILNILEVL
jgi:shikimate dehydrogenase